MRACVYLLMTFWEESYVAMLLMFSAFVVVVVLLSVLLMKMPIEVC